MERAQLIEQVSKHLHAQELFEAARLVLEWSKQRAKPKTEAEALEPVNALVWGVLREGDYESAAQLLWSPTIFTCRPRCTQMVWRGVQEHAMVLLQGSSSTSKTYSAGVRFFLDWLRDPEFTTVKVLGPSEAHLQENLFSHLVSLHRNASVPLPGIVGDLFIGLDPRNRRGAIVGTVVPLGRKGAGRLQGVKRFPRSRPHEVFGPLSRVRVLIDEIEKVPLGIWSDLDNIVSNVEGTEGLKVVGSYNPEVVGGPVYQRAEPKKGWAAFDPEVDETWDTARGWHVVRLDAAKTENVVEGRVIFPGLQTREGLEKLAQSSGGTDSPGYQTFGRGAYPVQGTSFSVIPGELLTDVRAKVFWLERPKQYMAVDSALEGDDPAASAIGNFGKATGVEFPPTIVHPGGRQVMFKDAAGKALVTNLLLVETVMQLERGNTVAMAEQIKRIGKSISIDPSCVVIDRTGNGAGVHDLVKSIWSEEIMGVNYSESPTHTKILEEDTEWCDERYDRIPSELWFAMRRWREAGALLIGLGVETASLFEQLTGRNYVSGKKNKVESKPDYKARHQGKSPNEADAVSLLLHRVRTATGFMPGLAAKQPALPGGESREFVAIVSITDRMQYLD